MSGDTVRFHAMSFALNPRGTAIVGDELHIADATFNRILRFQERGCTG
jgi:hypothetical protein